MHIISFSIELSGSYLLILNLDQVIENNTFEQTVDHNESISPPNPLAFWTAVVYEELE
jgi:hypothetical protein